MRQQQQKKRAAFWMAALLTGLLCTQVQAKTTEQEQVLQEAAIAAAQQNYRGIYQLTTADRIAILQTIHVYQDGVEYELVSALSGDGQAFYRTNQKNYTIYPEQKQVIQGEHLLAQMFPALIRPMDHSLAESYQVVPLKREKWLRRETNVFTVQSRDQSRNGYEVWIDDKTGLILRIDVVGAKGEVFQRGAFLDIDFHLSKNVQDEATGYLKTLQERGYQTSRWRWVRTTPQEQKWQMQVLPQGFQEINMLLRPLPNRQQVEPGELLQWVFSDGIATVSVFIEPQEEGWLTNFQHYQSGVTQGVSYQKDQWRITILGDVPEEMLQEFARALARLD